MRRLRLDAGSLWDLYEKTAGQRLAAPEAPLEKRIFRQGEF
jgi:hypothetical protein